MPESPLIDRNNLLPHAQDYSFLGKEGLSLIQSLSGETWTDYNTHDPGITLLELLCYALTDLGYRSGFSVQDILSPEKSEKQDWRHLFYTARQVLPSNPLTLPDYRKLIIDTEGVRNAWIEKSDDYEIIMYLQKQQGSANPYILTYDAAKSSEVLRLRGLYKVFVDYEETIIKDNRQDEVADIIRKKLQFHRNLCEDFLTVSSIEYEYFPVEAVIQVNEGSDIDMINARIFKVIYDLFSPPVSFYSLEQMLARKSSGEEIFNGPVLKYGFIDSEELAASERTREIHLSDIIRLVSAIDGVIAVKKFTFGTSPSPFTDFGSWVNRVKDAQKAPKLDIENSVIHFERSGDRHRAADKKHADAGRVQAIFSFFQSGDFKKRLKGIGKDFPVPVGEYMDIADYYPVQHSLPAAYGMNEKLIDDQVDEVSVLRSVAERFDAGAGPHLRRVMGRLLTEFPDDEVVQQSANELFEGGLSNAEIKKLVDTLLAEKNYASAILQIINDFYPEQDKNSSVKVRLHRLVDAKPYYSEVSDKAEVLGKLAPSAIGKPLFKLRGKDELIRLRSAYIKFQVKRLGKRGRRILQLRGFLMVFEQVMANHLSQLAHIRELLSFDPAIKQSFYPQVVNDIHDIEALFIDFERYKTSQLQLIETEDRFLATRNNILDHLLSRFSESMDKYSFFMRNHAGKTSGSKLVRDKVAFLSDYVQVSSFRGSGFNYTDPEHAWNSHNVEGLKKRICRLLGIEDFSRRTIATPHIMVKEITLDGETITRYITTLNNPANPDEVLLTSVDFEFESEAREVLNYILEEGSDTKRYELEGRKDKWTFQLKKGTQEKDFEVVAYSREFRNQQERDEAFDTTREVLNGFSQDENFHVLEHILLRPKVGPREGMGRRTGTASKADTVELLSPAEVPANMEVGEQEEEEVIYKFKINQVKDPAKKERTIWKLGLLKEDDELLVVNEEFSFYKHLTRRIVHIRESGADISNYHISENQDGNYKFTLLAGGRYLAEGKKGYRKRKELDEEIENLADFFSYESGIISRQVDDDNISYYADPYSMQVSILIPNWHTRFRVPAFRHLLEKTIYHETPAHVHPHIFWLDHKQMQDFEEAYKLWVEELASLEIPDTDSEIPDTDIVNKMVTALNELRKQVE